MKRLASWLIGLIVAVLTIAPLMAFAPPKPGVMKPGLSMMALGDTLKLRSYWRNVGTFDSIIVTYSSPRFATIRKAWPFGRTNDSSNAIPVPPLAPGDVVTVTVTFGVKIGVTVTPSGSLSAGYTQPGVLPDSLRVVGLDVRPSTATLALMPHHPGDQIQICTFARMADGRKVRTSVSTGPACDALWASYLTEAKI